MNNHVHENLFVQSKDCSHYDVTSICSCNCEVIQGPTDAILHQQSRFLIILDGKAKMNIQGTVYEIEKGSLVCVLPYQYTKIEAVEKELVFDLVVYNFELFNELIKVHLNFYNNDINLIKLFTKNNVVKCEESRFLEVIKIYDKLKSELGEESLNFQNKPKDNFSSIYISSQILELISIFSRQTSEKIVGCDEDVENNDYIFQYIYLNLSQNLTLKELSKIFYMSESGISSYIYNRTGYSYSDLLFNMKISRIENFLLYTDMTLDDISSILGYSDSSYISKLFTARTDCNISDFKKSYKNINAICKVKESDLSYKIVDYIYNNYYLDLSPVDLAKKFGINVTDLNFHLKYLVEKNFSCFLNYVRINKSLKMLIESDKSIEEISKYVGYDSVRSYNRNFKKYYNTNPSKFRQQILHTNI